MGMAVLATEDPQLVLERAGPFLRADPVRHNVVLTLLHARRARPEPGRYWVACRGDDVTGVIVQSPLHFHATITPMDAQTVAVVIDAMADAGVRLPGVGGEAGSAARFAGQWTERHRSAARPRQGQRLYEASSVDTRQGISGRLRLAADGDRPQVVTWLRAFHAETGTPAEDVDRVVEVRVAAGQWWLWDDGAPVSMAALTEPTLGVVRVQAVYTPPEQRNRGYAGACVAHLAATTLEAGHRSILYTDLGNATSNTIYRRIGYRAVAEILRYDFD
jgi:GNAT superfamily N-acetyltransferase